MVVEIHRETSRIKNGWSSRSMALGLTAHGYSKDVADINLERTILLFLMPFYREGTLADETKMLGLGEVEDLDAVELILN